MGKRPTGSGGEPSSPNCGASAGVKARQPHFLKLLHFQKLSSFPYLLPTPNFRHQQLSVNFALGIHFGHGWALVHGFEVITGRQAGKHIFLQSQFAQVGDNGQMHNGDTIGQSEGIAST